MTEEKSESGVDQEGSTARIEAPVFQPSLAWPFHAVEETTTGIRACRGYHLPHFSDCEWECFHREVRDAQEDALARHFDPTTEPDEHADAVAADAFDRDEEKVLRTPSMARWP